MEFQFDRNINRVGTGSLKYDFAAERGMPQDVLPMWVADMDFTAPQEVIDAMTAAARHGIFGYTQIGQDYFDAIFHWYDKRFHWRLQKEWMVYTPGVVFAICAAIQALTQEGDAVLIQRPVYYPFSSAIENNRRRLVNSPLVETGGRYHMNLDQLERTIIENQVKLYILCSPHNPVGRVWTREELTRVGDICVRHGVKVIADEIHADFVCDGNRHVPFASIRPEFSDISITCTAPSKTFNLAGLQLSNIFIPNAAMRKSFRAVLDQIGYDEPSRMGAIACQAAYAHGEAWLDALKKYLTENIAYVRQYLSEKLPEIRLVEPEGTYLLWLDCRGLGMQEEELERLICNQAKLWLDAGTMFGPEGANFERMNIACPRATVEQAMGRLERAVRKK